MLIRSSGRSSDYISPSFGYGCLYNCSYCYMKRHLSKGLNIATNINDILTAINTHAYFYADVKKPNQTHDTFVTYDIGCNEDFALHSKYYDWKSIFKFFVEHPIAMATFATKYANYNLLDYNPQNKVRIRFSLMPENIRQILEPNTSTVEERIKAIPEFIKAGYEVHINFSPVIIYNNWIKDYTNLFHQLKHLNKHDIKAEVIFLTHNKLKHEYNLNNNLAGEDLLWTPNIQETKTSEYGGVNLRYKHNLKHNYINTFQDIHSSIIPWNKIRYIF